MTDNKNPMPASPTDPNAHGLYDSPVYTLAGEYKRPQGTPPVAAGGGGGAAGATSNKPKGERKMRPRRKNTGVPAIMESQYRESDGEEKPADIPVALQPTTGAVMDVGIVDTIMVSCQMDRVKAKKAVESYLALKGNEGLEQVCCRTHSSPPLVLPFSPPLCPPL